MGDHDGNHRCLVEKNVPIVLILPSRWQYSSESLGIERIFAYAYFLVQTTVFPHHHYDHHRQQVWWMQYTYLGTTFLVPF